MDRLDEMTVFVAVADEGGLAAAGRRLGWSATAVTRAINSLEERLQTRLLLRTTRVVRITEAGERYLVACRRILAEIDEADGLASGGRSTPRGVLTISAPMLFGRLKIRPLVDAFLGRYPEVQARLLLLDRVVNLVDEGVDVAVRLGHLPDSSLVAARVGAVQRVLCASPDYLQRHPAIATPADLAQHACIAFSELQPTDTWTFASPTGDSSCRSVRIRPRLTVNNADAAIASAEDGHGVTCVLSYQIERQLAAGQLVRLLASYEPPELPVHVVFPEARLATAKARAFIDFVVPELRRDLAEQSGGEVADSHHAV